MSVIFIVEHVIFNHTVAGLAGICRQLVDWWWHNHRCCSAVRPGTRTPSQM